MGIRPEQTIRIEGLGNRDEGIPGDLLATLRLRNYPSLALFHDGKKKEVWKADMDGIVDVKNKGIKKAISDALAGDVF